MGEIIHLNEPEIKQQLGEMVRKSVEETLNAMLDAEADDITQAHRYERTESRADTRAGHYTRKLTTNVRGKMNLPSRGKDFFHCTVSRFFTAQ